MANDLNTIKWSNKSMKLKNKHLSILLLFFLHVSSSASNIYKCIDSNGKLFFKDTPCSSTNKANEVIQKPTQNSSTNNSSHKYSKSGSLNARITEAQIILDTHYGEKSKLNEATEIIASVIEDDRSYAPAYVQMARLVMKGGYVDSNNNSTKFSGNTYRTSLPNNNSCHKPRP